MTTTVTVNAGGGADYTDLQTAINSLPSPASGWVDDYEVLIQDSATYSYSSGLVVNIAATATFPLAIRADVGQTPTITNTSSGQACLVNGSRYVTFERLIIAGLASTVGVYGSFTAATDLTWIDCTISCPFSLGVYTLLGFAHNRWTFQGCSISGGAWAVDARAATGWTFRSCTFSNSQHGLTLRNGSGVVVERCLWNSTIGNTCMEALTCPGIIIRNNVWDRVVATNQHCNITGASGAEIYNNTWYRTAGAASLLRMDASVTNAIVKNNTFRADSTLTECVNIDSAIQGTLDADYNIYWKTTTGTADLFNISSTIRNWAYWQGTLGKDLNGQNVDPGHTNEAAGDYTSASASSAIVDAGTPIGSVTDDYLGAARPQGAGYDVGAYERLVVVHTEVINDTLWAADGTGPALIIYTLGIQPDAATLHGGDAAVVYANQTLYDTSQDETLQSAALPAGWSTAHVGSGYATATTGGLVLTTGAAAGALGRVAANTTGSYYDLRVQVESVQMAGTQADVGALVVLTGTDQVRLALYRNASETVARMLVIRSGQTIYRSALPLELGLIQDLRVVVGDDLVWALTKQREASERASDVQWSMIGSVRLPGFGDAAKTIYLQADNDPVSGGFVRTRFTNYQVRSAVAISNRLLIGTTSASSYRIEGTIPAATHKELGPVDFEAFGPWGHLRREGGFTYVLPPSKQVEGAVGSTTAQLIFTSDKQIRSK